MAEQFELTEEMKAQIGSQSPPWDYEVTSTSVRAFARGVGYTDQVYFDRERAREAGYADLPAPTTYLGTPVFIPGRCSDTFSAPVDGQPSVEHGLTGLLDGGTETQYHGPIVAGDVLEARTTLANLKVTTSKSLGKMLVVTMETTFVNKKTAQPVATQRSQILYF